MDYVFAFLAALGLAVVVLAPIGYVIIRMLLGLLLYLAEAPTRRRPRG